jgi:hypothetical protein
MIVFDGNTSTSFNITCSCSHSTLIISVRRRDLMSRFALGSMFPVGVGGFFRWDSRTEEWNAPGLNE